MNDVTDAFDPDWFTSIDINRPGVGAYIAGKWIDGATAVIPVLAIVQLPSAKDLLVLPEGLRTDSIIKLHSISILQGVSEEDESTADRFEYRGRQYMIHSATDQAIGVYYKALATRQNA